MHPKKTWVRWLGVPVSGFIAGWLSYIPLNFSINEKWKYDSLWWPFADGISTRVIDPYQMFGLVSLVYYFGLVQLKLLKSKRFLPHLLLGVASGISGSLIWWIAMDGHWYLSPLHGTIWGVLVGLGMWWAESQSESMPESSVEFQKSD